MLKNFLKTKIVLFTILVFCLIPVSIIFAGTQDLNIHNPLGDISTISDLLFNVIGFLIVLSIPISMILVVYAGFLYITSAGNEDKIKMAQKTLVWALVGFAIVLIARGVPAVIQEILSGK